MFDIIEDEPPCIFRPRFVCNRTIEGEWELANEPRNPDLFTDCDNNDAQLCAGVKRETILNFSNSTVYFFDKTGAIVYTALPTRETDEPLIRSLRQSMSQRPRGQRPEHYLPRDPVNPHAVRYGSRQDPLQNTLSKDDLLGGRRVGDEYHIDPRNHTPSVVVQSRMPDIYREYLVIRLRKVDPIGSEVSKSKKQLTAASNLVSRTARMADVQKWDVHLSVNAIEGEARDHDGCDALYHPGLGLWISTNRESRWVGEKAYVQNRDLVTLDTELVPNKIAPIVVFYNKEDFVGKGPMVFTFDRRTMFRALMVESHFMPRGEIRVATTAVEAAEITGTIPRQTYLNISLLNLRMSDYQVVVGEMDLLIAETPQILQNYLFQEVDEVSERLRTAKPELNGYIALTAHNRALTEASQRSEDDRKTLTTMLKDLRDLAADMGAADKPSYKDVVKRIQSIGQCPQQPEGSSGPDLSERLEKAREHSSAFAAFMRNTKEIIIALGVIITAVGTAVVWAKGWFSEKEA